MLVRCRRVATIGVGERSRRRVRSAGIARSLCIALALPLLAAPALAQDTIVPGHPALRPDRVRLATDTIVVLLTPRDSAERLRTTLVRRIERVRVGSEELFRETQHYAMADGDVEVDTLEVSARSLAFRRLVEANRRTGTNSLRSDGARLTGVVAVPDSGQRSVDVPLVPFFHSIMDEAFIGTFPLDTGVTLRVPIVQPPSLEVHTVQFTVTGVETVQTADGPVECLVVKGPSPASTAWIARSDRHLVRLHWTTPNGLSVWKLPRRDVPFRQLS